VVISGASWPNARKAAARVARSRGWCSSHYRRWRAGKPLNTPIRGYQKFQEGPDGTPVPARRAPAPRRKPIAKEYGLLASLGLR